MTGWILAFALAQALDAGTTCVALQRGFVEGNPFLPESCQGIVVVKAAVVVGVSLTAIPIYRRAPKKWRILMAIGVGAGVAPAIYNLIQMRGGV